jgi:peptidoglycan/xylan/chitin deacetylase (PgdA/CDA1 family)
MAAVPLTASAIVTEGNRAWMSLTGRDAERFGAHKNCASHGHVSAQINHSARSLAGGQARADWAAPGTVIRSLDTAAGSPYHWREKVVALTFDDGPSPIYTLQILRILAAASVPASFEIVGLHGAAYPGILRAENAARMALVNHSWTHADLALLPARRWPAEVDRTSGLLRGIIGHPVRCLRLPYGLGDPAVDA